MKKSFVLAGMLSFAMFLGACSSDSNSGSKSLAEKCEKGVSASCLEAATWNMEAFYILNEGDTAYTSVQELTSGGETSPSVLTFEEDGSFSLVYSKSSHLNSDGSCLGQEENGTWTLSGSVLTLKFTFGCKLGSDGATVTATPSIVNLDGVTALNLGGLYNHTDVPLSGFSLYEIFKGVEK